MCSHFSLAHRVPNCRLCRLIAPILLVIWAGVHSWVCSWVCSWAVGSSWGGSRLISCPYSPAPLYQYPLSPTPLPSGPSVRHPAAPTIAPAFPLFPLSDVRAASPNCPYKARSHANLHFSHHVQGTCICVRARTRVHTSHVT